MSTEPPPTEPPAPARSSPTAARPRGRTAHRSARAPAGELLSAASALLLLVLLSATSWYGTVSLPRGTNHAGRQSAASAWTELSDVRWLLALTILAALGSVAIHVSQRSHGAQTDTSAVVATLGTLSAISLFVRVLVALPAPGTVVDAKLGADLGLLAAVGIALGGIESMRARRRLPAPRPAGRASGPGPRRPAATAPTPARSPEAAARRSPEPPASAPGV